MRTVLRLIAGHTARPFPPENPHQASIVTALESMLEQARSGQLTGLMYLARVGQRNHEIHVVGDFQNDPQACLAAIESSDSLLHQILTSFPA